MAPVPLQPLLGEISQLLPVPSVAQAADVSPPYTENFVSLAPNATNVPTIVRSSIRYHGNNVSAAHELNIDFMGVWEFGDVLDNVKQSFGNECGVICI